VSEWQHRVPLLPSPLIGREEAARAAAGLLAGETRLLTLTGPPGVGKTTLALAVAGGLARRDDHAAHFVDLAVVRDPAQVGAAIVAALDAGATPGLDPRDRLVRAIGERALLLVLDNFEQVVGAAPLLSDLLAACPRLALLVTSREPLRLRWERELPIAPLPVPSSTGDVAEAMRSPALRLFAERARAVAPNFVLGPANVGAVAAICRHLDGLPLAIELAAARIRLLSPEAMLARLTGERGAGTDRQVGSGTTLSLLADGPRDLPPRHQTLHDAIDWSYGLLAAPEQALLRRLAVFDGGCTFEAAEAVCGASWEGIASLVEKSLLRYEALPDPEPRARMLETIRAYALARLAESGEAPTLRERHVAYFVDLAEQAEPFLFGPDQATWLDRLDRERGNLRAAGRWAEETGAIETALRLESALIRFWRARGDEADARDRVRGVLALAATAPPHPATVKSLGGAGELARLLCDYETAESLTRRSFDLARTLGDRPGTANALRELAQLASMRGQYAEARRYGDESLALCLELSDRAGQVTALRELGMLSYHEGDLARARERFERGLTVARALEDRREVANLAFSLALTYHVDGHLAAARALYEECLTIDRAHRHRASEGACLSNLGNLATLRGELTDARRLFSQSVIASRESGDRRRLAFTLSALAGLASTEGEAARALRLDAAGSAAIESLGARLAPAMRAVYDAQLAPARRVLGRDGALAAREAGRVLTLEQAIDEAVAWLANAGGAADGRPSRHPGAASDAVESVQAGPDREVAPGPRVDVLTRRERDVAVLIARGLSNREIAEALVITPGTAESYVHRVLTRLDFTRRSQVAAWAVAHRLHETVVGQ
jgi:predicted ATPase/DNA-binding CsgD family transcriptional regulator